MFRDPLNSVFTLTLVSSLMKQTHRLSIVDMAKVGRKLALSGTWKHWQLPVFNPKGAELSQKMVELELSMKLHEPRKKPSYFPWVILVGQWGSLTMVYYMGSIIPPIQPKQPGGFFIAHMEHFWILGKPGLPLFFFCTLPLDFLEQKTEKNHKKKQ